MRRRVHESNASWNITRLRQYFSLSPLRFLGGWSRISAGGVAVADRAESISLKSAGRGKNRSESYGEKLGRFQERP